MEELNSGVLDILYGLAAASAQREICGVVTTNLEVHPVKNVAGPNNHFVMSRQEWFSLRNRLHREGKGILAIYHSHLNGDPTPSQADIEAAERLNLNYLVVANNQYKWVEV